jgi:osmotically-inducible protein OsmY
MQKTVRLLKFSGLLLAVVVVLASGDTALAQFGSTGTGTTGTSSGSTSTRTSTSSGSTSGGTSSGIGLTTNTPINRSTTANSNQADTTGFVGGSSAETFVGGSRQATQSQGQNRQFQAFQPTQTTQNSQSQQTGTPRQVRTSLRLAFTFPAATAAQQSGSLDSANSVSLSRFAATRPELNGINVNMTNTGEAVLTGTVASTEASRLAANLVRLQPGVRKVNNQLGVGN